MPAGHEDLGAEMLAGDRERIVNAMAELVVKRGYRSVTMEMVQKRADVSRAVFRRHFDNRECCFLACFEHGALIAAERIEAAVAAADEWPDKVSAGLAAALELTAEQPVFARICLLEPPTVGAAGSEAQRQALTAAVRALRDGRAYIAHPAQLPDSLEESIVGALVGMVRRRLERGEAAEIPSLLPTMLQFALTPYLGAERAGALVLASRS